MDQFLSALRERGVPEECLKQMAEDKVKNKKMSIFKDIAC